ncbi:hypothetical protein HDU97_004712 [Phlyctochytrium planicorne]|nr:hypothetical protein HDU97_004712 [Phlyctochytrium planicorne]
MAIVIAIILQLSTIHAQRLAPASITAIAISKGLFFAVDDLTNLWMSGDKGSTWDLLDGTAYGPNKLAAISTNTKNIAVTRSIAPLGNWTNLTGCRRCNKYVGNSQGFLWGVSRGSPVEMLPDFQLLFNLQYVIDLAMRDDVYVVQHVPLDDIGDFSDLICSFPLNVAISNPPKTTCVGPPFGLPVAMAVSDKSLFVVAGDGTLYSTPAPISPISIFTDTGFKSPNAKALAIPVDENYPVLIDAQGQIQILACTSSDTKCSKAIPPPVPPPQTSSTTEETVSMSTTSESKSSFPFSQTSRKPETATGASSPLANTKSILLPQTTQASSTPSPSVPLSPTDTGPSPSSIPGDISHQKYSTPTVPIGILVLAFGGTIILIMIATAVLVIQRTSRMSRRMDETMAFVKKAGKRLEKQSLQRVRGGGRTSNQGSQRQAPQRQRIEDRGQRAGALHNEHFEGVPPNYEDDGDDDDDDDDEYEDDGYIE